MNRDEQRALFEELLALRQRAAHPEAEDRAMVEVFTVDMVVTLSQVSESVEAFQHATEAWYAGRPS